MPMGCVHFGVVNFMLGQVSANSRLTCLMLRSWLTFVPNAKMTRLLSIRTKLLIIIKRLPLHCAFFMNLCNFVNNSNVHV